MSQAFHLFQLQKIDKQIDQANARIAEINAFLQKDERLESARQFAAEKQNSLKKSQAQLKKVEQEVAGRRAKLEQSEENLYSGRIRVPKELQDLQNEIASLRRHISSLEDQQLEAMLHLEEAQAESESALAHLHKTEALVNEDQASLRGELNQLVTGLERLAVERKLLDQQISGDNRQLYDRLRKTRRGIAIAGVMDESCAACGATLTPAERQAARSPDTIFFCPSCGRIVYGG